MKTDPRRASTLSRAVLKYLINIRGYKYKELHRLVRPYGGGGVAYRPIINPVERVSGEAQHATVAPGLPPAAAEGPHCRAMQLPEPPPPPLAPLWDRVIRAQALPPDLDVQILYIAIRDRLTHPEWEVRLHALRVLADLLPLSGNALAFPFDQVVDNLGHSSPNVRKAALDALKVFCTHCEDPECAARAILDKCVYSNIRPHSANIDTKVNVITGLILSIPSVMGILRRRCNSLDVFPMFEVLGDKLFDPVHRDVAQRSLLKLRRVCGPRDYMISISRLDPNVQEKFRVLCDNYDEDSMDVYYAPRKKSFRDNNQLVEINHVFNSPLATPIRISTESSSEESFAHMPYYNNHFGRVIIETEIKFDSDTAITMTVLEENETESEKNAGSEEDCDSSDRNMLKYSDGESEDTDVVVKKVTFGGESIKIRTPDSDNQTTSEDDNNQKKAENKNIDNLEQVSKPMTPVIVSKMNDIKREALDRESSIKPPKKSGIPLPVIQNNQNKVNKTNSTVNYNTVKLKSKSLSELYDYFKTRNETQEGKRRESGFLLTLGGSGFPEKIPSPVETHKEVEVLHNLQRSPVVSPKRKQTRLHLEHDGFVLNLLSSTHPEQQLLSPRPPTPLRGHYHWEELEVLPKHLVDQLHNTENWISAVKAADQLHSALLDPANVTKVEPAALSLVGHMWALGDAVSAARAPAESAVCALLRGASNECARQILPALVARMGREPLPAALPHALLQRLALHHLVDLIFDPAALGISGSTVQVQSFQLRAALCLARAAGPAAVMAAVRRRLAGTTRADAFCSQLRDRLSRPMENIRPSYLTKIPQSQLPVPVRRRARSTPPQAAPLPPRRLRPLPDSAPLLGTPGNESLMKRLSPIPLSDRDSSALTYDEEKLDKISLESVAFGDVTRHDGDDVDIPADETDDAPPPPPPPPPRSPSILIEDYSHKSYEPSMRSVEIQDGTRDNDSNFGSQRSLDVEPLGSPVGSARSGSRKSSRSPMPSRSESASPSPAGSPRSACASPAPSPRTRDVRVALAECLAPAKHEDWQATVNGLAETERLACDEGARAPAASWRSSARWAAAHVRSLRSRVARAACSALGALYRHRGRALDPELEEAAAALLDRCADVNRFLRADAAAALVHVACGGGAARAVLALARRGAAHRAGPVRAAAARALARLVRRRGAGAALALAGEARGALLRAAGALLADASAEAREQGRELGLALAEDARFLPMLKEAVGPTRYRDIQKFVDKPRCR